MIELSHASFAPNYVCHPKYCCIDGNQMKQIVSNNRIIQPVRFSTDNLPGLSRDTPMNTGPVDEARGFLEKRVLGPALAPASTPPETKANHSTNRIANCQPSLIFHDPETVGSTPIGLFFASGTAYFSLEAAFIPSSRLKPCCPRQCANKFNCLTVFRCGLDRADQKSTKDQRERNREGTYLP